ncbi:phage portal protein [Treponema sp. Marseille-Q3903]|uniref:phage portal protein n=1 Tax=Treponema sp. Marseille-Q3903 TaxID=2766703 RepID=UPI0016524B00|nr:phage portal protein [Treponema sp. Marseille-Q3903]
MSLFRRNQQKQLQSFEQLNGETVAEDFSVHEKKACTDPYLQHAWVSVCIDILTRNVARAEFEVRKNGTVERDTALANLFRFPNKNLSRFDLWKQTCAWWSLDGEAFWWFGENYVCGIPTEIYILNPRYMQHVVDGGKITKWVYTEEGSGWPLIILPDEVIHFKDWNPWNVYRGVSPLVSLGLEVEQDLLAAKQNTGLLKEGGVPKGLLKTDQVLTEAEAELLARTWDRKYGRGMKNLVAVLGKGTEYQPLTFSPDVLKLYDMKKWNLYTLLAKYGIPPRVANIQDSKSSLSGTDTDSQHRAFWNYTLIPLLKNFEEVLEVLLFRRFNLPETGVFNLDSIPELQESEDAQSNRDIAEINAGLKTINDVLRKRGENTKPWGDTWFRASSLVPVEQSQ